MKIAKYLMIGGITFPIDIAIFAIFAIYFDFNYLLVNFVSFTITTLVNYFLSVKFVFSAGAGVRFSRNKEVLAVFIVSGIGLSFNQAILYFGVGILAMDKLLTKIIANGVVFFWNFSVRSLYIFSNTSLNK